MIQNNCYNCAERQITPYAIFRDGKDYAPLCSKVCLEQAINDLARSHFSLTNSRSDSELKKNIRINIKEVPALRRSPGQVDLLISD